MDNPYLARVLSKNWRRVPSLRTIQVAQKYTKFNQRVAADIYELCPLNARRSEIRVLVLDPRNGTSADDPITGHLEVHSLADNPEYVAVSYTWGSPIFESSIICNGRTLGITQNLHAALKVFAATEQRCFWIDQICVNQADHAERNSQVLLMEKIFKQAQNVWIWLHEETEETASGIAFAKLLASSEFHEYQESDDWQGLSTLFRGGYHKRSWVVQEVVAKQNPLAFIGHHRFEWRILPYAMIDMLNTVVTSANQNKENYGSIDWDTNVSGCISIAFVFGQWAKGDLPFTSDFNSKFLGVVISTPFDWLSKLMEARSTMASDPRDKIYAFRALIEELHDAPAPDYSKPVEVVYKEFMRFLFASDQAKAALSRAGSVRVVIDGLPSWCIDFSDDNLRDLWDMMLEDGVKLAGGPRAPSIKTDLETSKLTVAGKFLGEVISVGPPRIDMPGGEQYFLSALRWYLAVFGFLEESRLKGELRECHSEDDVKAAVARIIAYEHPEHIPRPGADGPYLEMMTKLVSWDRELEMDDVNNLFPMSVDHAIYFAAAAADGKSIFVTDSGNIGLTHDVVRVGDRAFIPRGADFMSIVRPCDDGKEYTLLCEAFALGYTGGKAYEDETLRESEIIVR